jgi:hypothetical protein
VPTATAVPTPGPDPRIDDIIRELKQLSARVETLAGDHDGETAQLTERVEGIASEYQGEITTVWEWLAELKETDSDLAEMLAAVLEQMSTPTYWPTIADYMVGVRRLYKAINASFSQSAEDGILRDYDQFASVYVAGACVSGTELSASKFQAFVTQTGWGSVDGTSRIGLVAKELITEMLVRAEGGTETSCMRPFLYPETGTELAVALGLAKAYLSRNTAPVFRDGLERATEESVYASFEEGAPFLEQLCGEGSDC